MKYNIWLSFMPFTACSSSVVWCRVFQSRVFEPCIFVCPSSSSLAFSVLHLRRWHELWPEVDTLSICHSPMFYYCAALLVHTFSDVSFKYWRRWWWCLRVSWRKWRLLWHVNGCCVSQGIVKTLFKRDWWLFAIVLFQIDWSTHVYQNYKKKIFVWRPVI